MKLNETVLFVDRIGDVELRLRVDGEAKPWTVMCPFRACDTQCGNWCPLFEIADLCTEPRGSTVLLHCGSGNRRLISLPVVEEVNP
jgi:hypothetical protein